MRKQKKTKTVALSESWKNEIFANFLTNFYRLFHDGELCFFF